MRLPSRTPRSRTAAGLARIRVLPELLAIRDERAAAATSAHPLGSALDIVNEHEEHAPAADAADGGTIFTGRSSAAFWRNTARSAETPSPT
jgi:hypothetical protein